MLVTIDGARITGWDKFHDVFAEAMGFPAFYGRNMDAWIDCMTCVDDPGSGMTTVTVSPGAVLTLAVERVNDLASRCPDVYEALVDCSAFVNWRRIERGESAVIALSFYKDSRLASTTVV